MFSWLKNPIAGASSLEEYEIAVDALMGNFVLMFALLLAGLELLRESTLISGLFVARYAIGSAAAVLLLKNIKLSLRVRGVLFAAIPTLLAAMSAVTDPFFVFVHHIFLALVVVVSIYFDSGMLLSYSIILNGVLLVLYLFHPVGLFGDKEHPGDIYFVFGLTNGIIFILYHVTQWMRVLLAESLNRAESMRILAFYDSLTGVANRASFLERLNREIQSARQTNTALAVAMMDIDNFKEINDSLGHEAGDQFLVVTAQRIKACIRSTDVLARIGGDEFCLVLPGIDKSSDVRTHLNRIIQTISQPCGEAGREIQTSMSIGLAFFPTDSADAGELLKLADAAMYQAKHQGKNRVQLYHEGFYARQAGMNAAGPACQRMPMEGQGET